MPRRPLPSLLPGKIGLIDFLKFVQNLSHDGVNEVAIVDEFHRVARGAHLLVDLVTATDAENKLAH